MGETVFFTHVPKTAGTSMKERVFENWIQKHDAKKASCRGYGHLLRTQPRFGLLEGHYACGVHRLVWHVEKPRYFVMLRDPVDRLVSHYHFIRTCNNPWYRHPKLDEVREHDLVSFYRAPARQNVLTRYVAGIGWEWAGRHLSLGGWPGRKCLQRAKSNLRDRYEAFGLRERFDVSARPFARHLRVPVAEVSERAKETSDRPTVSELPESTVQELRELNALDVKLYRFAVDHFEEQISETELESPIAT